MGDARRLSPNVLAAVDPQVFWAAVLRSKKFIRAINAAASDAAVGTRAHTTLAAAAKEWRNVGKGVKIMRQCARDIVGELVTDEANWDLSTEVSHRQLAEASATASTLSVLKAYPMNVISGW